MKQYDPTREGARNLAEWLEACRTTTGAIKAMPLADAIQIVAATPPARRSEFGRQVWRIRRSTRRPAKP